MVFGTGVDNVELSRIQKAPRAALLTVLDEFAQHKKF